MHIFLLIHRECRKNKAAYESMQLEHLIDLDQMTDWQDVSVLSKNVNIILCVYTYIRIIRRLFFSYNESN